MSRFDALIQFEKEFKRLFKKYKTLDDDFEKFKENKGITYIYSSNFTGFVSNLLPSFWGAEISKSFK